MLDYDPFTNKSEVAYLRWQIEQHCLALRRVAEDPGYCASHEAIQRRYQRLGDKEDQLAHHLGAEQAFAEVYEIYNQVMNQPADKAGDQSAGKVKQENR